MPGMWCAGRECNYESHCRHNLRGFVVGRVLLCLACGVQVGSRECTFVSHCRHNLQGFVVGRVLLCLARGVQVGSVVMRVIADTTY